MPPAGQAAAPDAADGQTGARRAAGSAAGAAAEAAPCRCGPSRPAGRRRHRGTQVRSPPPLQTLKIKSLALWRKLQTFPRSGDKCVQVRKCTYPMAQ